MRSWIVVGICAVGSLSTMDRAASRPGTPPIVLAQIKLGGSPEAPAQSGTIVKAVKPSDIAAFFKEQGVTEVEVSNEEEMQLVDGTYKGVQVRASLGTKTDKSSGDITLIAYLGKQDTVDQTFMNAFNKNYFTRLLKREDGTIILKIGANFASGVTLDYCKDFVSVFVGSIDSAAAYKVE